MDSETSAAARRIMDRLGEERRIPLVNVREGDLGVLFGLPMAGLLLASVTTSALAVPLLLGGVVAGVAAVSAAPDHRTAWTWLRDLGRHYLLRPEYTLSAPADADHDGREGGLVEYAPFTPSERTQELTSVARAWPGTGAVEREDGSMEAFLEIEPANMDFAMSGDWQAVQEAGEQFANSELEFPLTMHATTRSFPTDQLVTELEARLDDPAVQARPAFRELIEAYRDQRPAALADSHQHRYYLGVEVSPLDVSARHRTEPSPAEQLTDIPVVGLAFEPFVTNRADRSEAERRQAMFDRLDDRIRTVESEFVEQVAGWSASRCSTLEVFTLAAEFWNGTEYDAPERLLRESPAVGGSRRRSER